MPSPIRCVQPPARVDCCEVDTTDLGGEYDINPIYSAVAKLKLFPAFKHKLSDAFPEFRTNRQHAIWWTSSRFYYIIKWSQFFSLYWNLIYITDENIPRFCLQGKELPDVSIPVLKCMLPPLSHHLNKVSYCWFTTNTYYSIVWTNSIRVIPYVAFPCFRRWNTKYPDALYVTKKF